MREIALDPFSRSDYNITLTTTDAPARSIVVFVHI
jgi:hypothetical protein